MAYVFLTPHERFASFPHMGQNPRRDAMAFRMIGQWGQQLARRDGRGGHYQRMIVPLGRGRHDHQAILNAVVGGFRQAAQRARSGNGSAVLGVCMGHGGRIRHPCIRGDRSQCPPYIRQARRGEVTNFGIQLAPVGHLTVQPLHLRIIREAQRRGQATSDLHADLQAIVNIGRALRGLARVDVYTCNLGVGGGHGGLLDNLHNLWGVPIRGVRGRLTFDDGGPNQTIRIWVETTSGNSPRWLNQVPTDSYWLRSTGVYERPISPRRSLGRRLPSILDED